MKTFRILLAACAFLAASPALAADPAQLTCPSDQLSQAQQTALEDAAQAMAPMSDPRIAVLTRALADCARQHGWNATAREMARRYHLAQALRRGTRPLLTAGGMDLTDLERAILADDVLITQLQTATDDSVIGSLVDRHRALILRTVGDRGGELGAKLGAYMGAIVIEEASRRSFIAA